MRFFGVSSGQRTGRQTLVRFGFWDGEAQESAKRQRLARKKWDSERIEGSLQEYKEIQCKAKKASTKRKKNVDLGKKQDRIHEETCITVFDNVVITTK